MLDTTLSGKKLGVLAVTAAGETPAPYSHARHRQRVCPHEELGLQAELMFLRLENCFGFGSYVVFKLLKGF